MTNKTHCRTLALLSIMLVIVSCSTAVDAKPRNCEKQVKNVILLIADGTGVAHFTLSRWYNGGAPLAMDKWTCGLVRSYSANTPLTDSAPAATAFATGFKSFSGFVSVFPEKASMWGIDQQTGTDPESRPLVTVLEAARLAGKATGIVVTCEIPHATPAAFSAHHINRDDYDAILEQQVYNNIDVVLAGGAKFLQSQNRKDGEDLTAILRQKGYQLVRTRKEMFSVLSGKVWGFFAEQDISYDLDRTAEEPSLEEMTAKAIVLLNRHKKGFFLMVEGSKIDWAAHDNEPVGVVTDVLAFNRAVQIAIDFASQDGNTAVIVVSDHACGGLAVGDESASKLAETTGAAVFIGPLQRARHTGEGVEKILLAGADLSSAAISRLTREEYGLELTVKELEKVQSYFANRKKEQYGLAAIIGPLLSRSAHLDWTTSGHTGEDVPLSIYHPRGYRLTGVVQNTAIAWYVDEILNLKMKEWNKNLYLYAPKAFAEKGASSIVEETRPGNPVLVVRKGGQILRLPANKNQADLNGRAVILHSLIVNNGKAFFVPREALALIK